MLSHNENVEIVTLAKNYYITFERLEEMKYYRPNVLIYHNRKSV